MSANVNAFPSLACIGNAHLGEHCSAFVIRQRNIRVNFFDIENPVVGWRLIDGTVYAGMSPDTGSPMYTTPTDAPLTCTFAEAVSYAALLDAHGHKDWRVPTKAELNVLFQDRACIGGFNASGSWPAGWYWSGSHYGDRSAWAQRFSDGCQTNYYRTNQSVLRCIRG